jgi:AcrR family transcriptional regulator
MARPPAATVVVPTPERVLAAAEAAFAAHGFEAARLEDIAAAAGIRRPSLLHHFPTKEALYEAVVRRAFAALGAALRPALDGADLAAALEALVGAYLEFLAARPTFAPLVLREVIDGRGPGRELLLLEVPPLLDAVLAALARPGGRAGALARGAILQVAVAPLVRAAAGPVAALWGDGPDPTLCLARRLLLPGEDDDKDDDDPAPRRRRR